MTEAHPRAFRDDRELVLGWAAISLASRAEAGAREVGLTLSQFRVLTLLAWQTATPSRLAAAMDLKPPSVTRLVDRLVRLGFVERAVDDTDRRRVTQVVTPAGWDIIERGCRAIAGEVDAIATGTPGIDRETVDRGLAEFQRAVYALWWTPGQAPPGWPAREAAPAP